MLDYRIYTFLELCKYKNYSKAATALSISQPAVTQHIKHLEETYQAKFFHYDGHALNLTAAGMEFYRLALAVTADDQKLRDTLSHLNETRKKIIFGATRTIGEFVLPPMLNDFLRNEPELDLCIVIDSTSSLLNKLQTGAIECAFIEGYFDMEQFYYQSFLEDDFIAVCGFDFNLGKTTRSYLEDLRQFPLILQESESGTTEVIERILFEHNLSIHSFRRVIQVGNMNVMKYFIEQNQGITFLYHSAVKEELYTKKMRQVPLNNFNIKKSYYFIALRESAYLKDYKWFLQTLQRSKHLE